MFDFPADDGSADEFVRVAMEWHFSPDTGSSFWLDRAGSLGFDPRREIRTHADLRRFPNIVDELRDVSIADLTPRGYGGDADIVGVYDSGGTTGTPKRVPLHAEWLNTYREWASSRMDALGAPSGGCWLSMAPSGPHIFGRLMAELARLRGGAYFSIDLDPRWVRSCLTAGRAAEAERYVDHLVGQAVDGLRRHRVDVLVVTPPLLERMAERDDIVELIRAHTGGILWGGAHMDPDTRHVLRTEVFPDTRLFGTYGSTMILGGAMERPSSMDTAECVFDPCSPYMSFSVVDPRTGEEVAEGERGQVVMHFVSRSLLLPNNLERDTAIRVAAQPGQAGVSVADIAPLPTFDNATVIEGVY